MIDALPLPTAVEPVGTRWAWSGFGRRQQRAFSAVLAIKYATQAVLYLRGVAFFREVPRPWQVALALALSVAWLACARNPHWALFLVGFSLMLLDAAGKLWSMGPYFYNHFFLEVVIALIGIASALRVARGDTDRHPWVPLAYLTIAVWAIAALKKLLLGTYLSGEYLASLHGQARATPMRYLVNLLVGDSAGGIPELCCHESTVSVPSLTVIGVLLLGFGMAVGEFLPPLLVWLRAPAKVVGIALIVLTAVASGVALEWEFGLTNLALSTLWTGRRSSWIAVGMSLMFASAIQLGLF